MSLLEEALDAIRREQPATRARGVELLGVVGSVARGEERPDSDVDVAYRLVGRASLLALARALIDLRAGVGRAIDLIDLDQVDSELRAEFERDLVLA